ncbi:iron ABC transporter permease [Frankia sp. CNm7]|uniref:Iron ABC transporter permease n=1 Tax=Frankia nepalensis TaxID=1836974 RepID=A0A937URM7_9ACTN|nr:iron ABC transporter permease [Frankia nepalensis]MBL7499674.1 iron ABC transporter permease [Frankia nepalensis]MBL7515468.1 iron ABC transporter permease [Frankia nepalensis]MBL7522607.1 iron ABC transporter permease [Frankia nepalensis]MBL7629400.1 iron ABC transporter permease [Frankia nepalensis]
MTTTSAPAPAATALQPAADDLGRTRRARRALTWIAVLSAVLVTSAALAVSLGPVPVPLATVWKVIGHHTVGWPQRVSWTTAEDSIAWTVRAPRVLTAVFVGAGLAVCGVALQALVRNALAEPYLTGVSSGASTGAAAALLFSASLGSSAWGLSGSAFVGGVAATALVFAIARVGGRLTSMRLVLAGVTVSYALSAVTSFLIFASDSVNGARGVLFWLLGSLTQARWSSLPVPVAAVCLTFVALSYWARRLDALSIGDETALTLGVRPTRLRAQVFVVVAVCVGAVVAVAGPIGFVGLVVPHVARRAVGGEHRRVLPVAALLGAGFLVWADVAARTVFAPREIPLGVVTALVGAPFLLVLVRRFHGAADIG